MTTIFTLRQHLTEQVIGWQEQRAELYAAYAARWDVLSVESQLAIQRRLAYLQEVIGNGMEWLHDDEFMAQWCKNINRERSEFRP